MDHLEDLRWCIIKSLTSLLIFAIPCGIYWRKIFDIIMIYPLRLSDPKPVLIYTSPAEPFVLSMKIAVAGGLILGAPFVFYFIWKFISPGLYKKEKILVLPVVLAATLFFLTGVLFSYFTLPYVLNFFVTFAQGKLEAFFKAEDYLGFLIKLSLAFGVVFELPVISYILTKIDIITPKFLVSNIRYAIVIIFIVAAVLTPPDVISQTFLAVPLIVLYGISILVSYLVARRKK